MTTGDVMYQLRIRDLREDCDLSQVQVAKILKVHQTTYSDYENGNLRIPVEHILELAQFYNVDMNYICGVSDIKHEFPNTKKVSKTN